MLDDAVRMQGRQTKRKYSIILLGLALLTLGAAWLTQNQADIKSKLSRYLAGKTDAGEWVSSPCGPDTQTAILGDSILYVSPNQLCLTGSDGTVRYQTETGLDSPVLSSQGHAAVVYTPGDTAMTVADETKTREISVPGGICGAAVSDTGNSAAVTCGSGFETVTEVFDPDGTESWRVCLTDSAMAMELFLDDDTLISGCVGTDGTWVLRLDPAGTEIPLDGVLYDMKRCGGGVALWTSGGISFYSETGECTGSVSIAEESVINWDCGDYAAVLVRRYGTYRILTAFSDGTSRESGPLTKMPRDLTVSGNAICVLDSEAMLVYDKNCTLQDTTKYGAYAVSVRAADGGCWLFGDGEKMRCLTS